MTLPPAHPSTQLLLFVQNMATLSALCPFPRCHGFKSHVNNRPWGRLVEALLASLQSSHPSLGTSLMRPQDINNLIMRCFFGSFPYETTENSYPQKRKLPTKKKRGGGRFHTCHWKLIKKRQSGNQVFFLLLQPLPTFGGFVGDLLGIAKNFQTRHEPCPSNLHSAALLTNPLEIERVVHSPALHQANQPKFDLARWVEATPGSWLCWHVVEVAKIGLHRLSLHNAPVPKSPQPDNPKTLG